MRKFYRPVQVDILLVFCGETRGTQIEWGSALWKRPGFECMIFDCTDGPTGPPSLFTEA